MSGLAAKHFYPLSHLTGPRYFLTLLKVGWRSMPFRPSVTRWPLEIDSLTMWPFLQFPVSWTEKQVQQGCVPLPGSGDWEVQGQSASRACSLRRSQEDGVLASLLPLEFLRLLSAQLWSRMPEPSPTLPRKHALVCLEWEPILSHSDFTQT